MKAPTVKLERENVKYEQRRKSDASYFCFVYCTNNRVQIPLIYHLSD